MTAPLQAAGPAALRTVLLLLLGLVTSCAPPTRTGDAVEEMLGTMELRERLAVLVAAPEPNPRRAPDSLVAALPSIVLAPVADSSLSSLPPARLRPSARAHATAARAAGATLGLLRFSDVLRAGERGGTEETVREVLRAAADAGLPTAVSLFEDAPDREDVVTTDLAFVQARQGRALRAAVEAGVSVVLPGTARVPALTGDTLPLPLSRTALAQLHRDYGWEGVVAAEIHPGSALARDYGASEAAIRALSAGTDLLLGADAPDVLVDSLLAAVGDGRLQQVRINQAVRRVLRLRLQLARSGGVPPRPEGHAVGTAPRAALDESLPAGPDSRVDSLAPGSDSIAVPDAPGPATPAPPRLDPAALAAVDGVIRAALRDSLFTAAALAVAYDGVVVRLRGYGTEPSGAAVDPERTLFDLASLTKVMGTTTAVAALVEDGRMALEAPVRRYLPGFVSAHKDRVTIEHLLAHTSGLPPGLWLYGSARSPEQAMQQVLRQALRRPPGERAEYSDLGMIALAGAAEAAAGEPLDEYLARRVFAPLGMTSTMFLPPLALRERVIPTAVRSERGFVLHGVVHDGNAFRLGGVAGHAGLFSTARDVLVFGQAMLDRGRYGEVRILEEATVNRFTARQRGAGTRALGWDTPADRSSAGRYVSARAFGHTGYTGTSLWIDPELSLVVVLLTNRTYLSGSPADILRLRQAVHEGVARAIRDRPVPRRPGSR